MLGTKTIAAARRGVEAGALAVVGYLAAKYLALDSHTATGAVDVVRDNWDDAVGAGIATLLVGFGLTRSPVKNLSPVAENQPVDNANPDTNSNAGEGEQVA